MTLEMQAVGQGFEFSAAAARIAALRESAYNPPVEAGFLRSVGEIVMVLSSPRSGSSLLASVLRRTDQVMNFQGAITPFLGMADLRYPVSGDTDALEARHASLAPWLEPYLAQECGYPLDRLENQADRDQFAVDLAIRLCMQWPDIAFEIEDVRSATNHALDETVRDFGWSDGEFRDPKLFHALLIRRLRPVYPELNPYLYDIDAAMIRDLMPDAPVVVTLPSGRFVEMPPLITIRPWRRATAADLRSKPLVMKTVANTFRMPFLSALFPSARMRVMHLTRSVAGSANGMYDGWMHAGFWAAHIVDGDLAIPGYSDRFPDWGRRWWKFGLFPGWQAHRASSPVDIAAAHWRTCHETILEWLAAHPEQAADSIRVHGEDFLDNPHKKAGTLARIAEWLGVGMDEGLSYAAENDLPLQLATVKPAPQRWRKRYDELAHILRDPRNGDLMVRLGYDPDPETW